MSLLVETHLVIAALVLLFIGNTLALYWAFFDNKPPLQVNKSFVANWKGEEMRQFRAGDNLYVNRSMCMSRSFPAQVSRYMRGTQPIMLYLINSTNEYFREGCRDSVNVVRLPDNIMPGRYSYSVIVQWSNNPLHEGVMEMPAPIIEIVK